MYVLYCYQISIDVYKVNECKLIYDVVYNFFNLDYVKIDDSIWIICVIVLNIDGIFISFYFYLIFLFVYCFNI